MPSWKVHIWFHLYGFWANHKMIREIHFLELQCAHFTQVAKPPVIFYLDQIAWISFQYKLHINLQIRTENWKICPVRQMEVSHSPRPSLEQNATNTCHIVIIVVAVFVQSADFCLGGSRTRLSIIWLSQGFSWPFADTTSIARLEREIGNSFDILAPWYLFMQHYNNLSSNPFTKHKCKIMGSCCCVRETISLLFQREFSLLFHLGTTQSEISSNLEMPWYFPT